jgi:hypothetical protein
LRPHSLESHDPKHEAKLGKNVERQPVATTQSACNLKRLAFVAPPALGQGNRRIEAVAVQKLRACAEACTDRGVMRAEPQKPFDPKFESIDRRDVVECRADLCQGRVHGRLSLRSCLVGGAASALKVTLVARPVRHRLPFIADKGTGITVSCDETIVKAVTESAMIVAAADMRGTDNAVSEMGNSTELAALGLCRLSVELQAAEDLADDFQVADRDFFGRMMRVVGNDLYPRRARRAHQL